MGRDEDSTSRGGFYEAAHEARTERPLCIMGRDPTGS